MTETCGIVSVEYAFGGPRHSGSAGMLGTGIECQIVSVSELKALPPGQLGEIWVRGPNMMKGMPWKIYAVLSMNVACVACVSTLKYISDTIKSAY